MHYFTSVGVALSENSVVFPVCEGVMVRMYICMHYAYLAMKVIS